MRTNVCSRPTPTGGLTCGKKPVARSSCKMLSKHVARAEYEPGKQLDQAVLNSLGHNKAFWNWCLLSVSIICPTHCVSTTMIINLTCSRLALLLCSIASSAILNFSRKHEAARSDPTFQITISTPWSANLHNLSKPKCVCSEFTAANIVEALARARKQAGARNVLLSIEMSQGSSSGLGKGLATHFGNVSLWK